MRVTCPVCEKTREQVSMRSHLKLMHPDYYKALEATKFRPSVRAETDREIAAAAMEAGADAFDTENWSLKQLGLDFSEPDFDDPIDF